MTLHNVAPMAMGLPPDAVELTSDEGGFYWNNNGRQGDDYFGFYEYSLPYIYAKTGIMRPERAWHIPERTEGGLISDGHVAIYAEGRIIHASRGYITEEEDRNAFRAIRAAGLDTWHDADEDYDEDEEEDF